MDTEQKPAVQIAALIATLVALLALLDAAIETLIGGSPIRWWVMPPAVVFVAAVVLLWRPGGPLARRLGWTGAAVTTIGGLACAGRRERVGAGRPGERDSDGRPADRGRAVGAEPLRDRPVGGGHAQGPLAAAVVPAGGRGSGRLRGGGVRPRVRARDAVSGALRRRGLLDVGARLAAGSVRRGVRRAAAGRSGAGGGMAEVPRRLPPRDPRRSGRPSC